MSVNCTPKEWDSLFYYWLKFDKIRRKLKLLHWAIENVGRDCCAITTADGLPDNRFKIHKFQYFCFRGPGDRTLRTVEQKIHRRFLYDFTEIFHPGQTVVVLVINAI